MYPPIENLLWILLGAVITRILDKPIERYQRKIIYLWRRLVTRFHKSDNISPTQSEYRIGKWQVGWVVVDGSSSDPYKPKNVICQYDPLPLVLSPERQLKKTQIDKTQEEIEKIKGHREYHNGPTLALAGLGRGQIGDMEESLLILRLQPSDYYTFLATAISLNEEIVENGKKITVRNRYLRNLNYSSPIPEFASAFAIQMSVITSDGYIVVSKRATEGISGYAGYLAPAINECVNPISDRSVSGTISLIATTQRGASHELNIEIAEDEITFFTLGVDIQWYMYTLTGLICSKTFSKDDIQARRSIGSKEHWEANQYYFLQHDPEAIAKFMSEISRVEKWSPYGVVCITQTMIHEFGLKVTERALSKYPPLKYCR